METEAALVQIQDLANKDSEIKNGKKRRTSNMHSSEDGLNKQQSTQYIHIHHIDTSEH